MEIKYTQGSTSVAESRPSALLSFLLAHPAASSISRSQD
jgi:hypothetical protein